MAQKIKSGRDLIKVLIFGAALIAWKGSPAQVQWASKLLAFSSQYGDKDYAASNVMGPPTTMPHGGGSVLAWSPQKNSKQEFLKVGFKESTYISSVFVAENLAAGSIKKISLFDNRLSEHIVYTNDQPALLASNSRLFQVKFPITSYPVTAVYIEVDASLGKFLPQIDAVGVSEFDKPFSIEINLAPDIKFTGRPVNLGPGINSASNDVYPVISPDGKTLYFARFNHAGNTGGVKGGMDIWYSNFINGAWTTAKNIGLPLNDANGLLNNYVASALPDGNTLLVGNKYLPDGKIIEGISLSFKNGNTWGKPKGVEIENYYNNNLISSFCMANNGKVLLMGLERDDSFGRQDLYVSFRKNDGSWTEPKNIGPDVNTMGEEYTPFLASDGITMFFSSNGYPGYGENDIFITRRLDDTWKKWSVPQNLGNTINTSGWDAYYTVPASGEYAYFVSSNKSLGGSDLYKIAIPSGIKPKPVVLLSGKVLNAKTKKPINAEVSYETFPDGKQVGMARSNNLTGDYKITLPIGVRYGYWAYAKGYLSIHENIDLSKINKYQELSHDLLLVPIEEGQKIILNNLFFAIGEYTLLDASFAELDRIVSLMKENPGMEILLEGHTDYAGNPNDNMALSMNRVKAVKEYLVKNGVGEKRIQTKAFGGTHPIIKHESESQRHANRRVEIVILKK